MNILFVHGYSETSLGAYFDFPNRLQQRAKTAGGAPLVGNVVLSAFNSLDDGVTIDDLADALEQRVSALGPTWTDGPWAVICHSTGALIARRWILNRLGRAPIPTHLITLSGANHGSTLAEMGKSVLGYVQKLLLKGSPTVGASVLTDLEYGSDFLLRLNREWMTNWNNGGLDGLWAFSAGGDFVGNERALQVFWQTHEPGSDNTVRISGANLNYTIIEVAQGAVGDPSVQAIRPSRPIPHLVLPGYSHFGSDTGILGWSQNPAGDLAVDAVAEALAVQTPKAYADLVDPDQAGSWIARTAAWSAAAQSAHVGPSQAPSAVNATGVFTITDESARAVDDCIIAILDQATVGPASNAVDPAAIALVIAAANNTSSSILPHSPIQNEVQRGSYSFYFDYNEYVRTSPHWFYVEAALPGLVSRVPIVFTQPPELAHTLFANEFTYLALTMRRDPSATYAIYGFDNQLNLPGTTWMPFPPPGRLSP